MMAFPGAFVAGLVIFFVVVWDAFEVVILPRRVTRRFRLTRLFYRATWGLWKRTARLAPSPIASIAMTEQTPKMMPSAVRVDRSLCIQRLFIPSLAVRFKRKRNIVDCRPFIRR